MSLLPSHRRRGGQDGFALMAVLAVTALTAIVAVALLGLLLTTVRATAAQEQAAREVRAADGAIEAAITQMRHSPREVGVDPCALQPPLAPLGEVRFDQGTSRATDDVDVEITCSPGVTSDSGSTADQVRLVGDGGYQGDVAWTSSFPWNAALGSVPAGLAATRPNLVHSGHEALRFESGVTVKRGAAVLRNPVTGSPAVSASGQYLQGEPGLLALAGDGSCGLLSGSVGANGSGRIDDLDGSPTCGYSEAADVDASPTEALVGFHVEEATPPIPACAGSVVTFLPGRYDAARTRQVNALTGGGCPNRTFHFAPGVYSFDADSGSASASRHALVLHNPGSYFVFGAPLGWSPATGVGGSAVAGDPAAPLCDEDASGTSIVLSGRTEIHHLSGRVAMCPARSVADEPFPAVYQETSSPGAVEIVGGDSLPWTRTFRCTPVLGQPNTFPIEGRCRNERMFKVALASSSARSLSSVRVLITGDESDRTANNLVTDRRTSITVYRANGSRLCTTGEMSGTPNSGLTTSFELLTGQCATALTNESQLVGELRITHSMKLGFCLLFTCAEQPITVTRVQLQVNSAFGTATPASVSDPDGAWNDPGNVAVDDAAVATPKMPCPYVACEVVRPSATPADHFVHRLEVDDLSLALPPELTSAVDPHVTQLRLLMKLEPSEAPLPTGWEILLDAENFRPEMTTRLELRTASGERCLSRPGFVNSTQELAFDLIGSDDATEGCDAALDRYSQLQGADVRIWFEMPCVRDPAALWRCLSTGSGASRRVLQARPPSVQHVRLAAATDAYSGPPPTSQVNIDARSGSTGSAFNVMGKVWMPLSDLDVHWKGRVTENRPLFGADLVLNGLGSDMTAGAQMGAICCSVRRPDTRTVVLTARIGGVDRLRVVVRFVDVDPDPVDGGYSPGHAVQVLDWRVCKGGTCSPEPD